jgi:hypothetical protein
MVFAICTQHKTYIVLNFPLDCCFPLFFFLAITLKIAAHSNATLDSLDLPHMDPSLVNSPAPSSVYTPNHSFAATNGPISQHQPTSNPTPTHSPSIPNGIPGTPPYSPSVLNLHNLQPLSPNIANTTPIPTTSYTTAAKSSTMPTNISHPTPVTTATHTETSKPLTGTAPLPPHSSTTPTPLHPHTATNASTPNQAKPPAVTSSPSIVATAGPTAMHTQLQLEKAQKDLARLRQHLLEMEEQHTLETEAMAEKVSFTQSLSLF